MSEYTIDNRARLLLLASFLYEKSDENHGLSIDDIRIYLESVGIPVNRKTLYKDIQCLNELGHDIVMEKIGRSVYYHIGARRFELAELRLMIDAVQASHFLTEQKTKDLIRKLQSLASDYDSKGLENNVYISGQRKAINKSIFYLVNDLHQAIRDDHKVRFQYFQWDVNKKAELRHEGAFYDVSPWAMLFDHENYYMVGYDNRIGKMHHYRVDKIKNLSIVQEPREGKAYFDSYDMQAFTQSTFGMFHGNIEHVRIRASYDLAGVMIDRFGRKIEIKDNKDGTFDFEVDVRVSDQFLGWIIAVGENVRILSPESVIDRMKEIAKRLKIIY
ncbi:MAG: WYL domain-containing protein [Eubacterium sp.]|nr:WYL domain-containing protein [Eubacterium sp.]